MKYYETPLETAIQLIAPLDIEPNGTTGAFARVFSGYVSPPVGGDMDLAIKIMRSDQAEVGREAFNWEARILGSLKDDIEGVVPLLGCGLLKTDTQFGENTTALMDLRGSALQFTRLEVDDFVKHLDTKFVEGWIPYLVLKKVPSSYLNFRKLWDHSKRKVIPVKTGIQIAVQGCELLDKVHNNKVIYRDHKLAHYFWDESNEKICVIDWNASRIETDRPSQRMVTEDIASFGTMLFFVFTGRLPQLVRDFSSALSNRQSIQYQVDWRYDDQSIPESLREIVERTIQGAYGSAKAVAEDLKKISVSESKMSSSDNLKSDVGTVVSEADDAFYRGDFKIAIALYERALVIEPNYERAKARLNEAKQYLLEGRIPDYALPPETARRYGRALSLMRTGRYEQALHELDTAIDYLGKKGIDRWQDGENLRQNIYASLEAQQVFEEGLRLFEQGDFDKAIEKVRMAASVNSLPTYLDKVEEIQQILSKIDKLSRLISTSGILENRAKALGEAASIISELSEKYSRIQAVQILQSRLSEIGDTAFQTAKRLLDQAESSRLKPLESLLLIYREAEGQLRVSESAGTPEPILVKETMRFLAQKIDRIEKARSVLDQALQLITSENTGQLRQALKMIEEFPEYYDDPKIRGARVIAETKIRERRGRGILFGFVAFGMLAVLIAVVSAFLGNSIGFIVAAFLATIGFILLAGYLITLR